MIDNILLSALDGTLPSSPKELVYLSQQVYNDLAQAKETLKKILPTEHELAITYYRSRISLLEDLGVELTERIDDAIAKTRRKQFQL